MPLPPSFEAAIRGDPKAFNRFEAGLRLDCSACALHHSSGVPFACLDALTPSPPPRDPSLLLDLAPNDDYNSVRSSRSIPVTPQRRARVARLLSVLLAFSCPAPLLRAIFSRFQATATTERLESLDDRVQHAGDEGTDVIDARVEDETMSALLRAVKCALLACRGPSVSLRIEGAYAGIELPGIPASCWPAEGYTIFVWIRMEALFQRVTESQTRAAFTLLAARTATGAGLSLQCERDGALTVHGTDPVHGYVPSARSRVQLRATHSILCSSLQSPPFSRIALLPAFLVRRFRASLRLRVRTDAVLDARSLFLPSPTAR
jgi:hypothetical protein